MPAPEVAPNTDWQVGDDGVGRLTLTRPKHLNAIDLRTLDELQRTFDVAATDDRVRCVMITGQGRAFSAGGDINVMKTTLGDAFAVRERLRRGLAGVVLRIVNLEKPVVAAVNGIAYGAGMNLALACDIIIASREASFQESFAKVGLVPDTGGTWILPRLVGIHRAKELVFMAETLTAEDAHKIGIVNHVVPHDDLLPWATEFARRLANGPTKAFGLAKRLMQRGMSTGLAEALDAEADAQGFAATTADHREGVTAFFEKRAASFQGR